MDEYEVKIGLLKDMVEKLVWQRDAWLADWERHEGDRVIAQGVRRGFDMAMTTLQRRIIVLTRLAEVEARKAAQGLAR